MIKLTEAEEKVMKAIWDSGEEASRLHVVKILEEEYNVNWTETTIATYIIRLTNKHYIQPEKRGKYSRYKILVTENDYVREQLRWMFEYIYNGNREHFLDDVKFVTEK